MQKFIGVAELQRQLETVLDEVIKDGIAYVLLRGSRPEAALISYENLSRFQKIEAVVQELQSAGRLGERDEAAWQNELTFLRQRADLPTGDTTRSWTRDELYDR